MPRNNNNNSRRRPRRRVQNSSRIMAPMRTALDGISLKGKADPPTYQSTPWNTIVVGIRYPASSAGGRATLTIADLGADIVAQLGLTAGAANLPSLQLRVQSLQFWAQNTDGVTPTSFNVDVYDISTQTVVADNNGRILSSLTDVGARNHYAKSAYIFPRTQQNTVLSQGAAGVVFGANLQANSVMIAYVRTLWRFQPPQTIAPDLERELI